jgi:hypothetical protein
VQRVASTLHSRSSLVVFFRAFLNASISSKTHTISLEGRRHPASDDSQGFLTDDRTAANTLLYLDLYLPGYRFSSGPPIGPGRMAGSKAPQLMVTIQGDMFGQPHS